jgi:hypothetical protein
VQQTWDANNAKAARDLARKLGATWESVEVAGVLCFLVIPKNIGQRFKDRWLVHIHGGAFVLNGGEGCVSEALWVADACQARVLSIDYRRPPVHPFPAAIEDAVAVWMPTSTAITIIRTAGRSSTTMKKRVKGASATRIRSTFFRAAGFHLSRQAGISNGTKQIPFQRAFVRLGAASSNRALLLWG